MSRRPMRRCHSTRRPTFVPERRNLLTTTRERFEVRSPAIWGRSDLVRRCKWGSCSMSPKETGARTPGCIATAKLAERQSPSRPLCVPNAATQLHLPEPRDQRGTLPKIGIAGRSHWDASSLASCCSPWSSGSTTGGRIEPIRSPASSREAVASGNRCIPLFQLRRHHVALPCATSPSTGGPLRLWARRQLFRPARRRCYGAQSICIEKGGCMGGIG